MFQIECLLKFGIRNGYLINYNNLLRENITSVVKPRMDRLWLGVRLVFKAILMKEECHKNEKEKVEK